MILLEGFFFSFFNPQIESVHWQGHDDGHGMCVSQGNQGWTTWSVCVLTREGDLVEHDEQMSYQGTRGGFESVPSLMSPHVSAPAHM